MVCAAVLHDLCQKAALRGASLLGGLQRFTVLSALAMAGVCLPLAAIAHFWDGSGVCGAHLLVRGCRGWSKCTIHLSGKFFCGGMHWSVVEITNFSSGAKCIVIGCVREFISSSRGEMSERSIGSLRQRAARAAYPLLLDVRLLP